MQLTRLFVTSFAAVFCLALPHPALGESEKKIDFAGDVLPLLRTHCFDCHGPTKQKGGFRLDRRSDAMRGGTIAVIGPGNSAGSRLYHKLISDKFGPQMPPDGPLAAREIEIIKQWIDQGATWPDDLAGDRPATKADSRATQMMNLLRNGEHRAFVKMLKDQPATAKLKGPGGATPLMYAVLYGDAATVRLLLEAGADANTANDAGATPLMWAVDDPGTTPHASVHSRSNRDRSGDRRAGYLSYPPDPYGRPRADGIDSSRGCEARPRRPQGRALAATWNEFRTPGESACLMHTKIM
jgi:hypothetical protein